MHQPVQTGLGNQFALEEIVPFGYGELAGKDKGLAAVSVIDYLFEVSLEVPLEHLHSEVVDYQKVVSGYLPEEGGLLSFKSGESEVFRQHVHCEVYHFLSLSAGHVAECARKVRLSGPCRTGDEYGHAVADVFSGSQFADQ